MADKEKKTTENRNDGLFQKLQRACINGDLDNVNSLLLRSSSSISAATLQKYLALACRHGNSEVIDCLIGFIKESSDWTNFTFCAEFDPIRAARSGRDPDVNDRIVKKLLFNLWVDKEYQRSNTREEEKEPTTRLSANWANRHLPTISPIWFHPYKETEVLTKIDLSGNSLFSLQVDLIWGFPKLEELNLSKCSLNNICASTQFQYIDDLRLQILNLSHNKLQEIPIELFMIVQLKELNLSHNKIGPKQDYPKQKTSNQTGFVSSNERNQGSWRCCNLQNLDLSHNQLCEIPADIQVASKLEKLELGFNNLVALPKPWQCPLKELTAEQNEIATVDNMDFWRLTLNKLNLKSNSISIFPEAICELCALDTLNLASNEICTLPVNLTWKTYRLTVLDISNNLLSYVEQAMVQNVQDWQSKSPLRRSFRLSKGKKPEKWLLKSNAGDLQNNKLRFPKILKAKLKSLDLRDNKLQALPKSVCDMRNLTVLRISGNNSIRTLPNELGRLKELFTLDLKELQITHPPEVASILKQKEKTGSTETIITALKERLLDCKRYKGVKVMIMGPKRSGKTELLTCLKRKMGRPSSTNSDTDTPLNIYSTKGPGSIQFTVWDLKGGLEELSVINQTFLTPHTIYLLVWDVTNEESIDELPIWILNIKHMNRRSKIIAVGSHAKSPHKVGTLFVLKGKLNKIGYTSASESLDYDVLVNNGDKKGEGIQRLVDVMCKCAESMQMKVNRRNIPLIGRKVPKTFIQMQEHLSDLNEQKQSPGNKNEPPIKTEEDLRQIYKDLPDSTTDSQEEFAKAVEFLRDIGSLIHVPDYTYRLNNLFFIKPNWLYSILLKVINFKPELLSKAVDAHKVHEKHLEKLCKESGFGETRFDDFLQLLEKFNLAFKECKQHVDEYILPSLWTERQPCVANTRSATLFEYKLKRWFKMTFIPIGFFRRVACRILVDMNKDNTNDEQKQSETSERHSISAWKKGLSMTNENEQIDVEEIEHRKIAYICISVQSTSKDRLRKCIGFVVDHIEYLLNALYSEMAVQRMAPCPVCERSMSLSGKESTMENVLKYCGIFQVTALTVDAIAKGKVDIDCEGVHDSEINEKHHVPLKELVPDLFVLDADVPSLDAKRLEVFEKLDEGGFGVVHRAKYQGKVVAIKSFLRHNSEDEELLQESVLQDFPYFRREVVIMSRLQKHPCIVRLIGVSCGKMQFALEFAEYGDLASFMNERFAAFEVSSTKSPDLYIYGTIFDRLLTFKIAFQICSAVECLHQQDIIHTDLKTNNILVFTVNPEDAVNVKLADYGISKNTTGGMVRGFSGKHALCCTRGYQRQSIQQKGRHVLFGNDSVPYYERCSTWWE